MKFNKLVPEILVSIVEESLKFYTELIGFKVNYAREEEKFYFLEYQGSQIMIEQLHDNSRFTNGLPKEKPFGQGINFEIETDDADILYQKINDADYPIFYPLEEKWYQTGDTLGGNKQFVVADPDGYLLRFAQDLGKKQLKR